MWFWLPNKMTFVKWSTAYDLSRQTKQNRNNFGFTDFAKTDKKVIYLQMFANTR